MLDTYFSINEFSNWTGEETRKDNRPNIHPETFYIYKLVKVCQLSKSIIDEAFEKRLL
ncbi:MAG: hypothetical protein V3V16_04855 [Melioribacteraceae bacterium]